MATSIFVRSPYIVSKTSSVGNVVKAELYIYNNHQVYQVHLLTH
jgi:hypothetical protein